MKKKRLLVIVGLVLLGVIAVTMIRGALIDQPNTPTGSNGASPQPSPTATATNQPDPVPPTSDVPQDSKKAHAAAQASVTSVSLLSSATLLPHDQLVGYISQLATPSTRTALAVVMRENASLLAQFMGYSTVEEAATQADYYERPLLYHVDRLDRTSAEVSLFVKSHWVDAQGQTFLMPSISVVTLEKIKGRWFYAKAAAAAKDRQPELDFTLDYTQNVALFAPYLEGFSDVSSIVPHRS